MWQRRMVAPVAALAVAATLLASVAASQKKAAGTICPGGRFLLGSGVVDPAAGEEAVVISGGFVSIAKACPPARAKLTPGRSGMRVKAAWRACSGLAGKVHLSATVEPGCGPPPDIAAVGTTWPSPAVALRYGRPGGAPATARAGTGTGSVVAGSFADPAADRADVRRGQHTPERHAR